MLSVVQLFSEHLSITGSNTSCKLIDKRLPLAWGNWNVDIQKLKIHYGKSVTSHLSYIVVCLPVLSNLVWMSNYVICVLSCLFYQVPIERSYVGICHS